MNVKINRLLEENTLLEKENAYLKALEKNLRLKAENAQLKKKCESYETLNHGVHSQTIVKSISQSVELIQNPGRPSRTERRKAYWAKMKERENKRIFLELNSFAL